MNKNNVWIFGGEDQNENMINDMWRLGLSSDRELEPLCYKFDKKPTDKLPKLGTPCLWYGPYSTVLLYIGKSITQTLPPFKNYLCPEVLSKSSKKTQVWSQKEPLPFDGVPHTMEVFENQLILGFESSIYSIPLETGNIPTASSDSKNVEGEDELIFMKKARPKNLKDHMRQYFEEKPYPDVTFKVQGKEITAHRGILSVRCPYFQENFWNASNNDRDKSNPIEITDLSSEGFNVLLEWLYCNEIADFKEEVAIEILKAANKYSLPKLKTEAEKCLLKNLKVEKTLELARLAVEFNARDLETAVVNFIVKERNELNKQGKFDSFPDPIRERILNIEMTRKLHFNLPKIKMN